MKNNILAALADFYDQSKLISKDGVDSINRQINTTDLNPHEVLMARVNEISSFSFDESSPSHRRKRAIKLLITVATYINDEFELQSKAEEMVFDSLLEMILAIQDVDHGKRPLLFDVPIRSHTRTLATEGIAIDLMSSCRRFLIHTKKDYEDHAEQGIEDILKESNIDMNVESKIRYRNANRTYGPDLRRIQILNEIEFKQAMYEIKKMLSLEGAR